MDYMVMDARDRDVLWQLMKPFVARANVHVEGAKLAYLACAIILPGSSEGCEEIAEKHKAHIDAIVTIKRESMVVRSAFIPQFPLVHINQGDAPND